jgi:hypothetical protein
LRGSFTDRSGEVIPVRTEEEFAMGSGIDPTAARRRRNVRTSLKPLLASALVVFLAACQSSIPSDVTQAAETIESLSLIVATAETEATDLDGKTVRGEVVIFLEAEGWMREVRFFLNGAHVLSKVSAPYSLVLDTTALENGPHTLGVEARMANGRVRISTTSRFHIDNDGHDDVVEELPSPLPSTPDQSPASLLDLRGDAAFSRSNLSTEQRLWFDRLWSAIENPNRSIDSWAASGNIYTYGRLVNLHVHHLLAAFRITGDLRLLDEIDRISRIMESKLADAWRNGTTDGHRNWLRLRSGSDTYYGNDLHEMDEILTHAAVATMMYALHANRDLPSPSGINYGSRADFWYDYLKNDFEAKWRERKNKPTGFPFLSKDLAHTTAQWARYHHYMGAVTNDPAYAREATRLATITLDNFRLTPTPHGDAYIWCHRAASDCMGAQPTTYARYTVNAVMDMTWEGLTPFHDPIHLPRLATAVTAFIADNGTKDLAPDVASGESWMGNKPISKNRQPLSRLLPFSLLTTYDTTGKLEPLIHDAYGVIERSIDNPTNIEIPAAMLLHALR